MAAAAQAKPKGPPTGTVRIESISYDGDGCPPGSLAAALSDDGLAFTLSYSEMVASVGPGTGAADKSRRCQIQATVTVPPGWSYALASVDFRGFASLQPGVVAHQQSTYHISGESPEKSDAVTWTGAFEDDFQIRDLGAGTEPYFSRCGKGKNLKITTRIDVDNHGDKKATGLLAVDTLDGEIYHLVWQTCTK
jgi:hypothetical protein